MIIGDRLLIWCPKLVLPKAHALGFLGNLAIGAAGGAGLNLIQKQLGLKGPWGAVLNIGSQFMMVNALLGKVASSWGFVKPRGRVVTWGAMNAVNATVLAIDSSARGKVEKYIEAVKKEKKRYKEAVGLGGVGEEGEGGGQLVLREGASPRHQTFSGSANIKSCAVPKGDGFAPSVCPVKVSKSAFSPPKISRKFASGLTPSHLSTMKNISGMSHGLASGKMGADELASMDLAPLSAANKAMSDFNEKLIKKIDAKDKKRFRDKKDKPESLAEMLEKAKSGLLKGGASQGSPLASLNMSSHNRPAGEKKNNNESKNSGLIKVNPYKKGSSMRGANSGKEQFDFGLGDSGSSDDENREVAVNNEKSLDDFVLNHNDINKRKDASIFKILSNRYLLSYPKVLEEK